MPESEDQMGGSVEVAEQINTAEVHTSHCQPVEDRCALSKHELLIIQLEANFGETDIESLLRQEGSLPEKGVRGAKKGVVGMLNAINNYLGSTQIVAILKAFTNASGVFEITDARMKEIKNLGTKGRACLYEELRILGIIDENNTVLS